jgi:hypothetical protein
MERYCNTKTVGPSFKSREREFEDGAQDAIEWPVTWKPPHRKKAKDTWTHHYCFTVKESREKMAAIASGGIHCNLSLFELKGTGFMRFHASEFVGLCIIVKPCSMLHLKIQVLCVCKEMGRETQETMGRWSEKGCR